MKVTAEEIERVLAEHKPLTHSDTKLRGDYIHGYKWVYICSCAAELDAGGFGRETITPDAAHRTHILKLLESKEGDERQ